jgi:hypothetical protein
MVNNLVSRTAARESDTRLPELSLNMYPFYAKRIKLTSLGG